MFKSLQGFVVAHWQGRVALLPTLTLTLVGLRVAIAALGGIWLFTIDAGLYLWQVTGSWRAMRRYQEETPDLLVSIVGYTAILISIPLLAWPHLDRLALENLAKRPLVGAEDAGVTLVPTYARLEGPVSFAMFNALQDALEQNPELRHIVLNSGGGRVFAARAIARLVVERGLSTHVEDTCASACTLIFIAGDKRTLAPEARLGFHAYALEAGIPLVDTEQEEETDRAVFLSQGVSQGFVDRMLRTRPPEIWFPSRSELEQSGLLTGY